MVEHKNVVVAVRCRPLNAREEKRGAQCLVSMEGRQTRLLQPEDPAAGDGSVRRERRERTYTFDHCYWTAGDRDDRRYASQEVVFNDVGRAVLGHALSGYHCAILAYGQTSSGKTYTMMGGSGREAGLIPRIAQELFVRTDAESRSNPAVSFHVEVSYLEIYNERVRDLLNPLSPGAGGGGLRVREHPSLGPYVEDLTKAAVSSFDQVLEHMVQGNRARTVAATNMNAASSRSHAVFALVVTRRTRSAEAPEQATERVSRISLVDLAGSERASATRATGVRLREGARINQSLAALGKVISALAAQEKRGKGPPPLPAQQPFVPYRDSVLTWLLKDSLGGNSRTFMIATVSPADYGETLSTLRYADRAKHIVNAATVNEDATVKLVRQLKDEIAELRRRLELAGPATAQTAAAQTGGELEDQLAANEKLIAELNQSWEDKLFRTQALQHRREQALAALGIAVDTNRHGMGVGLHAPRDIPHLVNLSEDPLMSECLVYNLKPGATVVGSSDRADIRLGASGGVAAQHCFFDYSAASLAVHPVDGNLVMVNGQRIFEPRELRSGYRIIIGSSFVFRLNHPLQARQDRLSQLPLMDDEPQAAAAAATAADSAPTDSDTVADWRYAWGEAHPEFDDDPLLDGGYPGAPSVSTWSDTESEASGVHDAAPVGRAFPALAGSYHFARLQDADAGSCPAARPISQLSFRRGVGLVSRPRRGSAISEAGGLALLQDPGGPLHQRRARGLTLSAGDGGIGPASPLLGARRARRLGPGGAQRPWHLAPMRPLSTGEARERLFYERRLARMVIQQWRRYKLIKVGETILRNVIHIKEANVIGKELGQRVVYQFAIVRGGAGSFPASPLEPDALPALLSEDWDAISIGDGPAGSPMVSPAAWHSGRPAPCRIKALDNPSSAGTVPEVVVKVLDIGHACWYVWSLDAFHDRLDKMRRLSAVKGSYRAHLVLDPFHANPAPVYSCIGAATYPIWPGDRPYSAKIDAPVIDLLSGLERGRVAGSLAALPVRPAGGGQRGLGGARAWNVIVHVKALHGVSESELTGVHCRLRLVRIPGLLSSTRADRPLISPLISPQPDTAPAATGGSSFADGLGAGAAPGSPVLVSATLEQASRVNRPIAGFGEGPVNLQFRQQWTVDMLTEDTCVVVEFFGRAQPLALRRAFHEDVQMEEALRSQPAAAPESPERPLSASQNLLVERLHEEELFVDSQHEVVAWVRVLELGLDGAWERAPCSRTAGPAPAFLLRQGLQRRIEVVLGHSASQHLRIAGVAALHVGAPVLVDAQGRLADPQQQQQPQGPMAALPVGRVELADTRARVDNRCFVTVAAAWDTSVYGSRLLDLPTARGMRVRLALRLALTLENGLGTLDLATELLAEVCSRQSITGRRSWLAQLADAAGGALRAGIGLSAAAEAEQPASLSDGVPGAEAGDGFPPADAPVFRVFSVTLAPVNPTRGKESLWRLNTGKKYVRGEETLLPWQPRSVRVVDEYHKMECVEAWRLVVARARERLEEIRPELRAPTAAEADELRRAVVGAGPAGASPAVELTMRQQRTRQLVHDAVQRLQAFRRVPHCALDLQQEPVQAALSPEALESLAAAVLPSPRDGPLPSLAALRGLVRRQPQAVRPILMQGHFCHHGWMDILDTNAARADAWVRRWCVVERPYLFVFRDRAAHHLDNVVNIASARISVSPDVAEMVARDPVLALYTNTAAYLLAPPADEVQSWISAIDEWFYML